MTLLTCEAYGEAKVVANSATLADLGRTMAPCRTGQNIEFVFRSTVGRVMNGRMRSARVFLRKSAAK